jgi:hypothetical protein
MHGLSIYFVMGNSARRFLDLHLNAVIFSPEVYPLL